MVKVCAGSPARSPPWSARAGAPRLPAVRSCTGAVLTRARQLAAITAPDDDPDRESSPRQHAHSDRVSQAVLLHAPDALAVHKHRRRDEAHATDRADPHAKPP